MPASLPGSKTKTQLIGELLFLSRTKFHVDLGFITERNLSMGTFLTWNFGGKKNYRERERDGWASHSLLDNSLGKVSEVNSYRP